MHTQYVVNTLGAVRTVAWCLAPLHETGDGGGGPLLHDTHVPARLPQPKIQRSKPRAITPPDSTSFITKPAYSEAFGVSLKLFKKNIKYVEHEKETNESENTIAAGVTMWSNTDHVSKPL